MINYVIKLNNMKKSCYLMVVKDIYHATVLILRQFGAILCSQIYSYFL